MKAPVVFQVPRSTQYLLLFFTKPAKWKPRQVPCGDVNSQRSTIQERRLHSHVLLETSCPLHLNKCALRNYPIDLRRYPQQCASENASPSMCTKGVPSSSTLDGFARQSASLAVLHKSSTAALHWSFLLFQQLAARDSFL